MYASSDYHFERAIDDVLTPAPAPTPEPTPTVGLRRPSHDPDETTVAAAPPSRRADALQRGIHGGSFKGGVGVAAMIQESSLTHHGLHSGLLHTKPDHAEPTASDHAAATASPKLTVLERARADSRSKLSAASARRPSRELTSALANVSLSAILAAEHGADYALEARDTVEIPKPPQPAAAEAEPMPDIRLLSARRSSREIAVPSRSGAPSLGARRPSSGLDDFAALGIVPSSTPSISSLVAAEYFAPPTLRDGDAPRAAEEANAQEVESAIERARRVNWEAAIARGEAPMRRPSRDLQGLATNEPGRERARPTAASLLGH